MGLFSAGGRRSALGLLFATTAALGAFATEPAGVPLEFTHSALETALLPLSVAKASIPENLGVRAGDGGGIAIVDDTIVIVDLTGNVFAVRNGAARALALPSIENHADDYARYARKPMQLEHGRVNLGFRVHDVECGRSAAGIRLYVSYERYLAELHTTALTVSAILLDDQLRPLGGWSDVYEGPPLATEWYSGVAGGGRMLLHGDDLYLTAGDYNQDTVFMHSKPEAQNPDTDFGKILKIDLRTGVKTRISVGHRNPQGLTITASGTMYSTEHGPQGGDELNLIAAGKNYGWPVTTFGAHYGSYTWPYDGPEIRADFEKPVFAWVPSIGVSNLIELVNFHPAWDGDLLVESLRAQSLFRLRRDGEGRVIYSEPVLLGERLRDIVAMPDGTLALWTDTAKLIFIGVDHDRLAVNRRK
ncbi:MAG: PQQ-dependent sugar dehydrogenase [Alphaproteobacteria bacterium]